MAEQKMDPSFPLALTAAELRAIYQRNRTAEVRALLWEIARLHRVVRRANRLAGCFPLYDGQSTTSSFAIILAALRRELVLEACLRDEGTHDQVDECSEALFSRDSWVGKRAAWRRRNG